MTDRFAIENRIRDSLPIVFGKSEAVADDAYLRKRNAVTDYASAVTQPVLTAETVRYQAILLNVSLVLATLSLFRIGTFKIGDDLITVDYRFVLLYSLFIIMVTVIFLIKSCVDFARGRFTRERNDQVLRELNDLLVMGRLKTSIQEYFWQIIFDEIGETYKSYSDATARAIDREPDFNHISMRAMKLDIKELRKIPELTAEIERQETNLDTLRKDLAHDHDRFNALAESALSQHADDFFSNRRFGTVEKAFEETLDPWFEARNALVMEVLHRKTEEMEGSIELNRLKAINSLLKRIVRIRKIYLLVEVLAPIAFAAFVIIWVELGQRPGG